MTTAEIRQRPVGELLRQWREHRRLSQLELSNKAEVSTRHLSFLETGRSTPSRDMVLHLADRLEVPLRERNTLLVSAGYAPVYTRTALDSPEMAQVREAVRQILTGHDPYPAVVVDRHWNLLDANSSASFLTAGAAEHLTGPSTNVLRLALHPEGMAPQIINHGEWRSHVLGQLRRQLESVADPELTALYEELRDYPCADAWPDIELMPAGDNLVVPLRIRRCDVELSFFSTIATFGTPLDVTVAELVIESFFPADEVTRTFMTSL
ncbi:helix-turn-helix domain-containing protein [Kutzneria sp. CA-103260]|uniref:helix-turn-helix domain-containing protein n=1 Tax=Kutzneria sp. CA-103260 TaxID=2802641 RepID=UPI001BA4FE12|nr:helix-turn-helix transcriptional regulator [Kutzneria sp. CA-103260]